MKNTLSSSKLNISKDVNTSRNQGLSQSTNKNVPTNNIPNNNTLNSKNSNNNSLNRKNSNKIVKTIWEYNPLKRRVGL